MSRSLYIVVSFVLRILTMALALFLLTFLLFPMLVMSLLSPERNKFQEVEQFVRAFNRVL